MEFKEYLAIGNCLSNDLHRIGGYDSVFEPAGKDDDKKIRNLTKPPYSHHIIVNKKSLIASITYVSKNQFLKIESKEPFLHVGIKGSLLPVIAAKKFSLKYNSDAYFKKDGIGEFQGVIFTYGDRNHEKILDALVEASRNLKTFG